MAESKIAYCAILAGLVPKGLGYRFVEGSPHDQVFTSVIYRRVVLPT